MVVGSDIRTARGTTHVTVVQCFRPEGFRSLQRSFLGSSGRWGSSEVRTIPFRLRNYPYDLADGRCQARALRLVVVVIALLGA